MKHLFRLIPSLLIIFLFHHTALGATSFKIGVVDIQKLQKASAYFQKTSSILKKKFDIMQQKLDTEKKALLRLEEDFRKQSMMLSLDAQEDKKRELEKKKRYYKYLYEDSTQEMKAAEVEATKRIGKELKAVVEKIGKKEGYTVILEKRTLGLLYYSEAIDITDQVTKAYDKTKK